jgi:hypothetical protein
MGVAFLEVASRARNCATCAHASDQMRDTPLCILPDFGTRGQIVCLWVRGIIILVHEEGVGNFLRQLACHGVVAARVIRWHRRRADNHLGAHRLEHVNLLARLLVGGGEDGAVAAQSRHHRQPHSGVAGGAFDNRATRLQFAFTLRLLDHAQRDSVLHAPARVHELQFRIDSGLQMARDALKAHQRCSSNRIQKALISHSFTCLIACCHTASPLL